MRTNAINSIFSCHLVVFLHSEMTIFQESLFTYDRISVNASLMFGAGSLQRHKKALMQA